jgi:hypothetical protein
MERNAASLARQPCVFCAAAERRDFCSFAIAGSKVSVLYSPSDADCLLQEHHYAEDHIQQLITHQAIFSTSLLRKSPLRRSLLRKSGLIAVSLPVGEIGEELLPPLGVPYALRTPGYRHAFAFYTVIDVLPVCLYIVR